MRGRINDGEAFGSLAQATKQEAPHEKRLRLIYGPSEGHRPGLVEALKNLQGENKHERLQKNPRTPRVILFVGMRGRS